MIWNQKIQTLNNFSHFFQVLKVMIFNHQILFKPSMKIETTTLRHSFASNCQKDRKTMQSLMLKIN